MPDWSLWEYLEGDVCPTKILRDTSWAKEVVQEGQLQVRNVLDYPSAQECPFFRWEARAPKGNIDTPKQ